MDGERSSIGVPWYELDPNQSFRTGVVAATLYSNTGLESRDIRYILGGSLIQPDYGHYDLKDLWASSDLGQTWIPVIYRHLWNAGSQEISLAIDDSGVIVVNVDRETLQYGSELYVSLNGGRGLWGSCRYKAPYGSRHGGLLFFDRQGYLYVVGGYRGGQNLQDIWKSQISFKDLEAVGEKCQTWSLSPEIGLSYCSLEAMTNLKLQPVLGTPLVQGYQAFVTAYWQIGVILLSLATLGYVMNPWCQKISYRLVREN